MCAVSMVMDHYADKWQQYPRRFEPFQNFPPPYTLPPQIPQSEIDEFRKLLERAREYDKKNNEPDCGLDSKKARVKDLADKLGVKIDFL